MLEGAVEVIKRTLTTIGTVVLFLLLSIAGCCYVYGCMEEYLDGVGRLQAGVRDWWSWLRRMFTLEAFLHGVVRLRTVVTDRWNWLKRMLQDEGVKMLLLAIFIVVIFIGLLLKTIFRYAFQTY